jgi:ribosomal protein S18 acetylase RimI-like enzyme
MAADVPSAGVSRVAGPDTVTGLGVAGPFADGRAADGAVERVMAALVSSAVDLPGVWAALADDLAWASLGVPLPSVNLVFGAHLASPADANVERRIDEAIAWFDERGLPFVWWILPSTEPADLGARLIERGFTRTAGEMPAMAVALAGPPHPRLPDGVTIEPVRDPATYRVYCDTLAAAFDAPAEFADAWHRLVSLEFGDDLPLRPLLGWLDGKPVATGLAVLAEDIVGLYSIGTIAGARGRGIGRAMTLATMQAGWDAGRRVALLEATEMGYPLYRSIGFETITTIELYLHEPG